MDVIVDTNVFIDAIFHDDKECLEILQREHKLELFFIMSNEMTEELIKTVFYHAISLKLSLNGFKQPLFKICRTLRRVIPFEPQSRLNISADPDDNMFIECAVGTNCEYIVSSDSHLLDIEREIKNKAKKPIKIITPYEFINIHNLYRLKNHFKS